MIGTIVSNVDWPTGHRQVAGRKGSANGSRRDDRLAAAPGAPRRDEGGGAGAVPRGTDGPVEASPASVRPPTIRGARHRSRRRLARGRGARLYGVGRGLLTEARYTAPRVGSSAWLDPTVGARVAMAAGLSARGQSGVETAGEGRTRGRLRTSVAPIASLPASLARRSVARRREAWPRGSRPRYGKRKPLDGQEAWSRRGTESKTGLGCPGVVCGSPRAEGGRPLHRELGSLTRRHKHAFWVRVERATDALRPAATRRRPAWSSPAAGEAVRHGLRAALGAGVAVATTQLPEQLRPKFVDKPVDPSSRHEYRRGCLGTDNDGIGERKPVLALVALASTGKALRSRKAAKGLSFCATACATARPVSVDPDAPAAHTCASDGLPLGGSLALRQSSHARLVARLFFGPPSNASQGPRQPIPDEPTRRSGAATPLALVTAPVAADQRDL